VLAVGDPGGDGVMTAGEEVPNFCILLCRSDPFDFFLSRFRSDEEDNEEARVLLANALDAASTFPTSH